MSVEGQGSGGQTGSDQQEFSWVGNSTIDFSVSSSELEEAMEKRDEWRSNISIEEWETDDWKAVKITPTAEDARNNSKASGDANILHKDPNVVEESSHTYPFVREIEQDEDVVVNQGMSLVDALEGRFDGPLERLEGEWTAMVYALEEDGDLDQVVLSDNYKDGFKATLFPEGRNNTVDAGEIRPQYPENPEEYHENHNRYLTALTDQAVGRSFNTNPEVRNGELLIANDIEAEAVDWENAEEFIFRLEEVQEKEHQIIASWEIDVDYGEEVSRNELSYEEISTYADGFEQMDSVESFYNSDISLIDPYIQATEVTTTAALTPLKIGTALMRR